MHENELILSNKRLANDDTQLMKVRSKQFPIWLKKNVKFCLLMIMVSIMNSSNYIAFNWNKFHWMLVRQKTQIYLNGLQMDHTKPQCHFQVLF